MPEPLLPAKLAFTESGTPYSAQFGDVYHSEEGGPAQALHVFLGGNGLPQRWQGHKRFTILETGFGLGLNFLATWAQWKSDDRRPAKLHFVSIEKHPFGADDLAKAHAPYAGFAQLSEQLRAAWPMLVPGMHRLEFEQGQVVLTLCFADVADALAQLRTTADAIYLDGFSPAKNPGMWGAPVMKALGRLSGPDTTLATYSVSAALRDALGANGFAVEKRAGFARKREMLCGRFTRKAPQVTAPERRAIVIGAGLAGPSACERLASRHWELILIERRPGPAMEGSGNHAGVFHPLITKDDNLLAQLSRACFLYALRHWQKLEGTEWATCGVLQMPRDESEDASQRAALSLLGYPPEFARHVEKPEASHLAGTGLAAGGIWFPLGGWVRPATLVRALIAKSRATESYGVEVASLARSASGWAALDAAGKEIASAPTVVLANAVDAVRLAAVPDFALRSVRGQVSELPASGFPPIRAVLLRGGMALPPVDGVAMAGASFDLGDPDPTARPDSHAGNLERLERILPGAGAVFDPAKLQGRVGFRAVAPDRLPLVGAMPGFEGLHGAFAYGSRGILWCSLMGELLASRLEGEPLPVEARLAGAVDPARFALRAARRATPRAGSRGSRP